MTVYEALTSARNCVQQPAPQARSRMRRPACEHRAMHRAGTKSEVYEMSTLNELDTPAALLDTQRMQRNILRM